MALNGTGDSSPAEDKYLALACIILKNVPLIDGHNDFPYIIRGWFGNQVTSSEFNIHDMPVGQTDLTRMKCGQVGGQFWSAFVPCPTTVGECSDGMLLQKTLQQIDLLHALFERFPGIFGFVDRSTDIWESFRSGRIASLIGVEGLHQIANSASVLRMFHRLGVRYVTLTHNCSNMYADSATSAMQPHNGLSEPGKMLLKEMNRQGMIVDLSHTSENTQKQALIASRAPLIFSHSSCYALCPHPRNVSDEILEMLRENGGVIMICFLPSLIITDTGNKATLAQVADHIVYAGEKIGYRHVGIGSDFDGMLEGPVGLDDTSCYPQLVAELLRRGVAEEDVKMVLGLNIIRVLEEVERFAEGAKSESTDMMCDEIGQVWRPDQRALLVARGAQRKAAMSGGLGTS